MLQEIWFEYYLNMNLDKCVFSVYIYILLYVRK